MRYLAVLQAATAATVMAGVASGAAPTGIPPGVVVETVQRGSTAELGGVRKGDVLVSWSQADGTGGRRGGEISPLLLADLEYGQLPRGSVVLHGMRAGTPLRAEIKADAVGLGLSVRPRFSLALLDLYRRGRQEIDAGRVKEGTALWSAAAARARKMEGGTPAACWLLGQAGTAWAIAQHADAARDAYYEAVTCAEDVDPRAAATILEWQATQESELGATEATLAALEIACALRDTHPESPPLSAFQCHFDLQLSQMILGRAQEAGESEHYLLQMAERNAPDSLLMARVLMRKGFRDQSAGELEAAEAAIRRAADIAERTGPWSSTWARTQITLANLVIRQGDLATAEELHRTAMTHAMRNAPDSLDAARSLLNVGSVASGRGDLAAAQRYNQAALRILARLPTGRTIRGAVLNNLGQIALERGETEKALRLFERAAADINATAPVSYMASTVELNLSEALSAHGDVAAAREHADKALDVGARAAPGSGSTLEALIARGRLARLEGDGDLAEEYFDQAVTITDELGFVDLNVTRALQGLAWASRRRQDAAEAERHLRRAVSLFDTQRGKVGRSDEERSLFLSSFHGVYRDLIDLLVEQGRMAEAFDVLEASRARTLLSMVAARDLTFDLDVPPELERERRSVDAEYERARQRLAPLPEGAVETRAAQEKLAGLRERQLQIADRIRRASPRLAELREPQPLDDAGVAAHLDPGTLLVAYSIGSERTVAFALEAGQGKELQGYLIAAGEDELRRRIGDWRKRAQASPPGPRFQAEARALYELLLGPLAEPIGRAQRLVISADGPLHALPFAALRDERGFLAESKPLAFVSSGTLYARQAVARGQRSWSPPAAFGDPLYGAGPFTPLPGSRREVSAVATVFPGTREYVGGEATEDHVKALRRDSRLVHFAVHGIADERVPLDSALVLSTRTRDRENGLLHAWEVFERVRLDADLVTLSACRSAAGADRPGEGIIGLTRAFLYAGARSVLASLWNVGDASTGPFMQSFYKAWARGATKAEALRHAQVDAIRRGQRPLGWAGFQLYGDDR